MRRVDHDAPNRPRPIVVALSLVALAVVMTWPLGRLWRPELPNLPDAALNVWRLAWVAHQLVSDPGRLFEANIFSPAAHTLAYSDAMLLLGFIAAPLIWLGVHPFAVHNLLVIAAFWSASYFTYRLCLRLTSSHAAALIGGIVGGYAPYRFGHIAHLELLWTAFLPLGFSALLSLFEHARLKSALRLSVFVVLQTLCRIYYGLFFVVYLAGASSVLAVQRRRRPLVRIGLALVGSAMVAIVALLPYALIYREARGLVEERTPAEIAKFSASHLDYLHVSYEHLLPLPRDADVAEEHALYPGLVAVGLAVAAVATRPALSVLHAGLLVASIDLSFGLNGVLYPVLLKAIPVLASLRAPARFGAFVIMSLAVLSAIGAARILASRRSPRGIGLALCGLMLLEYWAAPLATQVVPTSPPALYTWIASQPPAVIVELPLPVPEGLWKNETDYQLMSIYHWRPMANGYSGNAPIDYIRFLNRMRTFPDETSLEALRQKRVRWVILHEALFERGAFAALMERVVESEDLRSLGSYADPWGRATVLEVVSTTL